MAAMSGVGIANPGGFLLDPNTLSQALQVASGVVPGLSTGINIAQSMLGNTGVGGPGSLQQPQPQQAAPVFTNENEAAGAQQNGIQAPTA